MLVADLRSDTLTTPTQGMREAMMQAPVGDDVYGEDPSAAALEREIAELLGHEAGLFTPTGTMAGQLAIREHVRPGQELLADDMSHVLRAEMGAAAAVSGITTRSWHAPSGLLDPEIALALVAPSSSPYLVATSCIVVENTHNFGGGRVQALAAMRALYAGAHDRGVRVHLDGARLWNAHVASGVALVEYGACADTVSVCLSKGLGAPVGSVVVGSAELISSARVWRKRWGGGMRQIGMLAQAGRYAVSHHVQRLAVDHQRAARVAALVDDHAPGVIAPATAQTNILNLDVGSAGWDASAFVSAAEEVGVRGFATDARHVRLVWHLDVSDEATDHCAEVLTRLLPAG